MHCNTLQHTATHYIPSLKKLLAVSVAFAEKDVRATPYCVILHCNTLPHYAATRCNTLPYYTATHCNTLRTQFGSFARSVRRIRRKKCARNTILRHITLQHTAILHCDTLQYTATHCIPSLGVLLAVSVAFAARDARECLRLPRSFMCWSVRLWGLRLWCACPHPRTSSFPRRSLYPLYIVNLLVILYNILSDKTTYSEFAPKF